MKLQELSNSGDPHAQKRLKNVRTKLAQLDKIVPYLGKYISVNRQAELQTIAVLKESCTMELQKFSQSSSTSSTTKLELGTMSVSDNASASDAVDSNAKSSSCEELPQVMQLCDENPYASLSEVKNEGPTIKLRSNYAELDFQKIRSTDNIRPPSVQYSEVRIDSSGLGRVVCDDVSSKDVGISLPTAAVQEHLSVMDDCVEQDSSVHDTTLTPENAVTFLKDSFDKATDSGRMELSTSKDQATTSGLMSSRNLSPPPAPPQRIDSIAAEKPKTRSPPPVSKKPTSRQLVTSEPCTSTSDNNQRILESDALTGMPSVMDRIKVSLIILCARPAFPLPILLAY